jgi:hypothetical protein
LTANHASRKKKARHLKHVSPYFANKTCLPHSSDKPQEKHLILLPRGGFSTSATHQQKKNLSKKTSAKVVSKDNYKNTEFSTSIRTARIAKIEKDLVDTTRAETSHSIAKFSLITLV